MARRTLLLLTALALVAASCSGSDDSRSDATADEGATGAPMIELPLLHAEPNPDDVGRIIDAEGREVLLRGVNVNAYAEYWSGNEFPTVFPFGTEDADRIAELGWNVVRLLFTWSTVEPEPGQYDEGYLDELEGVVEMLEQRGIYTVLDSHQDAWGPTLAARDDEVCEDGNTPANGWDGAPGWATLVDDATPRCTVGTLRETSPAVREAVGAFFANEEGPGGVGIRTRYAEMWGHVAERFATNPAVAGYDILNEPNAFTPEEQQGLADLYNESQAEIRAGEQRAGGDSHMILFEPPALWSTNGEGPPLPWDHDDNVVYSPHIYQGAFTGGPITRDAFVVAVEEAKLFGGAPVLTGEWGTAFEAHGDTQRSGPDGDGYFLDHQRWQDEFHISATIWEWKESCGDPHKVNENPLEEQVVAGIFEIDCATNEVVGERDLLISDLTRAYPQASPGILVSTDYDDATGALEVVGAEAEPGVELVVFYPTAKHAELALDSTGLGEIEIRDSGDGWAHLVAATTDADWTLSVAGGSG